MRKRSFQMIDLPESFAHRMKALLKEEYEDYYTLTEVEHLKLLKKYDNNL